MTEQWIKQMQQKMADYKQPAPEVSWDAVDEALAANKPHKLTPLGYWLRGIAAAAVLLLITGISYRIMHQQAETPDQQQATAQKAVPSNNRPIESAVNEPQPILLAQSSAPQSKTTKDNISPVISESVEVSDNTEKPVSSTDTIAHEAPKQTKPVHFSSDIQIPSRNNGKHQTGRLMAQAYMSNAMSGSRQSEYNRQTVYNDMILKPNGPITDSNQNGPMLYDTIFYTNTVQTKQIIQHHQPVRFGLSLRYQLDDRWSLESGLTYTMLASDITNNRNGIINHTKQKLHYLGIPLNVGYKLLTDNKLGLYISAGGTVDKLLNGRGWQFSLNGSAGADYILNNRFSLYVEPGVGYYFPNNSNINTIYQEHPLNFNLNLGLRFNLK